MIEKIFPELITSENKTRNEKINSYLDYIFNNNFKENEVTPDKMITLVNIDNYSVYEKYLYKSFSIPFYFQINSLETGKYFGHTALETNSKGSITIITLQDSSFGIIEKNDYFRLLSKINKELDMNFFSALYNLPFFHNISKSAFQRFYSSFFEYHLYKRNTILYEMKKKTNILYLIKNGRFSIYINGNMLDVYDILIYLQKEKIKKLNKNKKIDEEDFNFKYKIKEKDEKDDLLYNKKYKKKEFNDAVFSKNEIYLGSFEGNNFIGLVDFVDKNKDISLFNIKIQSNFCELYEITKKNFNILISDYSSVNDIIEEYEIKKLDVMINKINSYKKLFFSSLEKKENENINFRLSIQQKEKEIAIFNKTQKTKKFERFNKNIYLSINKDKMGKTNNNNFYMNGFEFNNWSTTNRTLENKRIKKNYSEKKRKMFIKEKILEKQNKELFLIGNGDLKYKNKILQMKKNLLLSQNLKKRISIKKELLTKINSNKFDNITINTINNNNINNNYNNNNNTNLNHILSDVFFVDKIKQALFNNNSEKDINKPFLSKMKSEKKRFYINMFMNESNCISSKKLLINNKNKEKINGIKNVNKSVGTIRKKLNKLNSMKKFNEYSDGKEIKIENSLFNNYRNQENFNKFKKKIEEYKKREKTIIDKLKININKMQANIDSSNIYNLNRKKLLETEKELNTNQIYDDLFY